MSECPIRVLLVEDNLDDVVLVRATLAAGGGARFNLAHSDLLEGALARQLVESFDVVLLDLGLPDSQGLNTFDRAYAQIRDIPIVVLSGSGDDEIAMSAVQHGAQDYLPKSDLLSNQLSRSIRYAIERHRAQLELARYAAELSAKNQELMEELQMARDIQEALLPHNYPQVTAREQVLHFSHVYRPAAALSGDFFSILRLPDNQAGVMICDVMGHGVRAALIGTLARGLVDQFLPLAANPGNFLATLNHELTDTFRKSGIESFASAFYFVADLERNRLVYANAGHPNALIVHRNNGIVEWLYQPQHRKPPLGLLGNIEYPAFEAPLDTKDTILLFTDGLFEAENSRGEQFGRGRLHDAVSRRLDQPCDRLLQEVVLETQEFVGREDFSDDVCLVGMDVETGVRQVA